MKSLDEKAEEPAKQDEEEGDPYDLGRKLLFVKASIISVLVLGQRILDRRRLELIALPRFEVPRHEGGSLNDGHRRKTRKG